MERKTCGDCIFYHGIYDDCGVCTLCETDETFDKTCDFVYACEKFQPKQPMTNGDKIRQMSNDDLAKIISRSICESCIYQDEDCDCTNHDDGILAWLNAPAESEVNNG